MDNLLGNRRSARGSSLLPSNCSATEPTRFSPPCGRRSRPFQRGATEFQAWKERIYLAAIIWLRLRRAEFYSEWMDSYYARDVQELLRTSLGRFKENGCNAEVERQFAVYRCELLDRRQGDSPLGRSCRESIGLLRH